VRSWSDLPEPARALLERIEESVGIPVTFVGTGQDRAAVIERAAFAATAR
jgi:adenylosuccinate synthase